MSPLLFNILLANIEEEMEKVKLGRVRIGGKKIYSLAYAVDLVIMAEEEDEMRNLMERLEG